MKCVPSHMPHTKCHCELHTTNAAARPILLMSFVQKNRLLHVAITAA